MITSNIFMNLKKQVYYLLLLVNNTMAFFLIGISFLSGPPPMDEKEIVARSIIYRVDPFIRLNLYILIVSIVFSTIAYVLSFFFRRSMHLEKNNLKKIFLVELALFIGVFIIAHFYIYLKFNM